jgi:hypothetical protein
MGPGRLPKTHANAVWKIGDNGFDGCVSVMQQRENFTLMHESQRM